MFELFWMLAMMLWTMLLIGVFIFFFIVFPIKVLTWMFGGGKKNQNCNMGGAHKHDAFNHSHDHTHGIC